MYMYIEFDYCDYLVVGIFFRKEIFWKILYFCVFCEGKILLIFFGNYIFLVIKK